MEPLSNLIYLLEPSCLLLIFTAVMVVLAAAHRALVHERESERHKDLLESSITLSSRQALLLPIISSLSLLLMFYLFTSVSLLITAFTTLAAASSISFSLSPLLSHVTSSLGALDPLISRKHCGSMSRNQALLAASSAFLVASWLVSGHWVLNNMLGVAICVAFVSHVKLPNIRVCALLLSCLFLYDIFWVFFSHHFFGANVMVTVATQQAQNPVHAVAQQLHLPVSETITKQLDLPVKLLFPRDLLHSLVPYPSSSMESISTNSSSSNSSSSSSESDPSSTGRTVDYMMLGLGDMAIPGMLLALVLCFDHRKSKAHLEDSTSAHCPLPIVPRGYKYVWCATWGYAIGLIAALGAGVLTRAPQPALLYLVPCTLGPVAALAWAKGELGELWSGSLRKQNFSDKGKEHLEDP